MVAGQPASKMHWLGRFVSSRAPWSRPLKVNLLLAGIALGLYGLATPISFLVTDEIFRKDFLAVFVVVRAIAEGADPFARIDVLTERYVGAPPFPVFDHPTPHPPTLALLALPLAGLSYQAAAWVWLGLELLCFTAAVMLLGRIAGARVPAPLAPALAIVAVAWTPVQIDLAYGQMNAMILLALCGMVLARRAGRRALAGALLALALLIKPVAWPLALALLLRRDWRGLMGVAAAGFAGAAATAALIGPGRSLAYAREILPEVSRYYERFLFNISIWTSGHRLFAGALARYDTGEVELFAPPLVEASQLALPFSAGLALLLLAAALWQARRLPDEWALALMTCLSIIINPIAWLHYVVLALFPVALAIRSLVDDGFPARRTSQALVIGGCLLLASPVWQRLGNSVGQLSSGAAGWHGPPPVAGLFMLAPTLTVIGLGCLIAGMGRSDRQATAEAAADHVRRATPAKGAH
jgi:hypothetical protein